MKKLENGILALIILAYIENVFLILLAGFLCWYFKSLWGLIALFFATGVSGKINS